jgi:hypothetical protein
MPPTGTIHQSGTVNPLFVTHPLNGNGQKKVWDIRAAFTTLLGVITENCPDGRELAIVKTKLEEAGMYTVKCISLVRGNQDEEAA